MLPAGHLLMCRAWGWGSSMASVTGSQLAFFGSSGPTNLVLTATGTGLPAAVAGQTNIEVFTQTVSGGFSLAPGYQGSAFVSGAVLISNEELRAGSFSEQLLSGSFQVIDRTGNETIQIVGGSGSNLTVTGSAGDSITGSTVSGVTQLI